jgi:hypothetical protein
VGLGAEAPRASEVRAKYAVAHLMQRRLCGMRWRMAVLIGLALPAGVVMARVLALGALVAPYPPQDVEYELTPDPDGKFTFSEPRYRLRVPREQFIMAIGEPGVDDMVFLSVDRREFGEPEPSGPPRISCRPQGSCADYCAPTPPDNRLVGCPDIWNGWYRVEIISAARGVRDREGYRPASLGFYCGDDGHPGLEFCWDPTRVTPRQPVTNERWVPYAAIRVAAGQMWVSTARGADGLPSFYAGCNYQSCSRLIEHAGAAVRLKFEYSALDNWQQIEARLHVFAEGLIKPAGVM